MLYLFGLVCTGRLTEMNLGSSPFYFILYISSSPPFIWLFNFGLGGGEGANLLLFFECVSPTLVRPTEVYTFFLSDYARSYENEGN